VIIKKIVVGLILFCEQLSACGQDCQQEVEDSVYQVSDCGRYHQQDINGPGCQLSILVDRQRTDFNHCAREGLKLLDEAVKSDRLVLAALGKINLVIFREEGLFEGAAFADLFLVKNSSTCRISLGKVERVKQVQKIVPLPPTED
jgi:hypothetical protein